MKIPKPGRIPSALPPDLRSRTPPEAVSGCPVSAPAAALRSPGNDLFVSLAGGLPDTEKAAKLSSALIADVILRQLPGMESRLHVFFR